jgi:hypothetical protein
VDKKGKHKMEYAKTKQPNELADTLISKAIQSLDSRYGDRYAKTNPQLLGAVIGAYVKCFEIENKRN